ncbi:MAG: hypothetical protein HZB44_07930 [Actinobacteria bacterium]|nr:hypothetical protein [Actinomycetota bacterium]
MDTHTHCLPNLGDQAGVAGMDTRQIKEFRAFLKKELIPAADDLEKLADTQRMHIQKLMFTNLVDRFDSMVDAMLLDNCREEFLVSEAFKGLTQPITESTLLELLMKGDDLQAALDTKLKDSLRFSVLRLRHSRKLAKLFSISEEVADFDKKPRVNPSNGDIVDKFKIQVKTIPHSICGYADWLYSKRNAIVHGAGTAKFLENDKKQIKKFYGVTTTKTFRVPLSAIRTGANFYEEVCDLLEPK